MYTFNQGISNIILFIESFTTFISHIYCLLYPNGINVNAKCFLTAKLQNIPAGLTLFYVLKASFYKPIFWKPIFA